MAKKTTIGGQAIIEGIMMKGPSKLAMAVRKPDGEIALKVSASTDAFPKRPWMTKPIIRGAVGLVEAMKIGMEAIMYSASFFEDEPTDSWWTRRFGEKADKLAQTLTVVVSILLSLGLFMVLPNGLTSWIVPAGMSSFGKNLVEGGIRLAVFLLYIGAISRLSDMKRLFCYHGAEHKTISCYEAGEPLEVDVVKRFSALHPRCGTSFLFMVMIVSIVVLSFFGWPNPVMRLVIRLLALPFIAGITYELNRWIGRSDSRLARILSYPGLMVQKFFTIREPDEAMIAVAISAMEAVLPEEGEDDTW